MSSHRKCDHIHLREFEREHVRNSFKQIYIWRRFVIMLTGVFGGDVMKSCIFTARAGLYTLLHLMGAHSLHPYICLSIYWPAFSFWVTGELVSVSRGLTDYTR